MTVKPDRSAEPAAASQSAESVKDGTHGLRHPDPEAIATRRDFGRELTALRNHASLSVRELSKETGIPTSTLGGYFAGTHLPALVPKHQLRRILRATGVVGASEVHTWEQAYWRVKGGAGEQLSDEEAQFSESVPVRSTGHRAAPGVSTRPPVERLDHGPTVRGREELLDRLEATVTRPGPPHGAGHQVLHGLGGCGKSTVALALVRRAAARGVRTWWITADDATGTTAGMLALAVELGATADELRLGSPPDILARLLGELDTRWLLVLDNADDPPDSLALPGQHVTDGTGWLRPHRNGTIMVTTRDGTRASWGRRPAPWLHLHHLTGLDPGQGALVLRELTDLRAGDEQQAAALSACLGGLPLALSSAGRYLAGVLEIPAGLATGLPRDFAAYEQALTRGANEELLAVIPEDAPAARRRRLTVAHTWELSLDQLADRGLALARPLLRLLACLGPSPVPYALLLRSDLLDASPLFADIPTHGTWDALRGLDGLALITLTRDQEPPSLFLHPLVRHTARHHPAVKARLNDHLTLTTALLTEAMKSADPKSPDDWELWGLLADHCAAPLDLLLAERPPGAREPAPADCADALNLARDAASFLRAAGHPTRADAAYTKAIGAARGRLVEDDPVVLALRHDLARVRSDLGRLDDAEDMFRATLAERRRRLGDEHPDTLVSQHYLARTLRNRGRLSEAGDLSAATLRARTRLLGDLHPDTLTSRNGLADHLRATGHLREAWDAYAEVLDLRSRVLGPRHTATLVTRHHMAEVSHAMDQLPAAETALRELITISAEVRGGTHPRTLAARHSLIAVLHDSDALEEAERLARQLVIARTEHLGATHPATLLTRHRLALILLDRGSHDEARHELRDVLTVRRRVLGPDHPHTRLSQESVEVVRHRLPTAPTATDRSRAHGGTPHE
ncbi:tetratricopeptide repeat protein [Streptomyces sp. NBC_01261]|uniref:tetratricopeptide repeat protein n=1 Tax=Streptomyces sp. NBC_01261 TaxID=2903802 RepID=UPI002E3543D6|nr:tetratricopeptide repeat protein [Streptomyces sp. NBC_01261]